LSVIFDFRAAESSSDGTIYFPGDLMRSSVARLGYALIVLVAASYALITLRGPQGVPALIQKQKEIRLLEKQNADLAREIESRRQRIQRLREDESEQELEIRQRLKLVRPGEKVFILQEPVAEKSPSPQP
jgi:cell division protein FtsB